MSQKKVKKVTGKETVVKVKNNDGGDAGFGKVPGFAKKSKKSGTFVKNGGW